MRTKNLLLGLLVLAASASVSAAALRLHVTETVIIQAPVAKVWDAVKDFDHLNGWHPAVAQDAIVEGQNNVVGAVRVLTLKDGGTVKERLLAYDAAKHTMKYSILEGVVPVSDYTATLSVSHAGKGRSLVTWSAHFRRKNTGDNPAENENDKTAVDTIKSIFRGGLDNLKKQLEATQ